MQKQGNCTKIKNKLDLSRLCMMIHSCTHVALLPPGIAHTDAFIRECLINAAFIVRVQNANDSLLNTRRDVKNFMDLASQWMTGNINLKHSPVMLDTDSPIDTYNLRYAMTRDLSTECNPMSAQFLSILTAYNKDILQNTGVISTDNLGNTRVQTNDLAYGPQRFNTTSYLKNQTMSVLSQIHRTHSKLDEGRKKIFLKIYLRILEYLCVRTRCGRGS